MALTTLNEVKTFLGIPLSNTDKDALITMFKDSVEASIIEYCEQDFTLQVVTNERNDGGQSDTIIPDGFPIRSVQALVFGVDAQGNGGLTLGTDEYYFDESGIYLRYAYSPYERGIIRIDYSWGYSSVPANVKMAVYQSVKAEMQRYNRNTEDVSGRSKNGESENYGGGGSNSIWDPITGLPKTIVAKLQPYKRIEFPSAHYAQKNI